MVTLQNVMMESITDGITFLRAVPFREANRLNVFSSVLAESKSYITIKVSCKLSDGAL